MSTYLARIEKINEYHNIRPLLQFIDGGFIEVDPYKFGQYGTITIGAIYGKYNESPFIVDGKYVIFELDEEEFKNLEQTPSGRKIKAADFITKVKSLESKRIREVIDISEEYSYETFDDWKNDIFQDVMYPITSIVYLSNGKQVIGPFTWREIEYDEFTFEPKNTSDKNDYFVNIYNLDDFYEPIYKFDASSKKIIDNAYNKTRSIILEKDLPEPIEEIDCIDNISLREMAYKIVSSTKENRRNQKEIKEAIMSLPNNQITDSRKDKLLSMFKNQEISNEILDMLPAIIIENDSSVEKITQSILDNRNYSEKIYYMIQDKEGFKQEFSKLDNERKDKENEIARLEEIRQEIEKQIYSKENIDDKRINHLEEENKILKAKIIEYENLEEIKNQEQVINKKCKDANDRYIQLIKMNDSVSEDIKKRIEKAYIDLAFDGAISSMILKSAAEFENMQNDKEIKKNMASIENIEEIADISTPIELRDYLYNEINTRAKRDISKNDIANIILCISQGFLTILAGEPGSGKTSLVEILAHMLGLNNPEYNRYQEISVEKGWTSRRDLIGYYNPLTKSFDASNKNMLKCLEILNEENKMNISDFLYLILLDEANLSQMEYYWADFMGLCDFNKKIRKVSLGEDYNFDVAKTLRFIATINTDHTTEILSPRLIDRSWIIIIKASDVLIEDIEEVDILEKYPMVKYEIFEMLTDKDALKELKLDTSIIDKFNKIRDCFQNEGINFSPRVVSMIKKYCLASKKIMDFDDNVYVALDYAISQKIMPMINGYGESYEHFLKNLLIECDSNTMPICNNIINSILKIGESNMQYYQFFSR